MTGDTAATCQGCGVPLPPSKTRPRKWCGERCRRSTMYAGARAARAASREERYRTIEALWAVGLTMREIAARMDTTTGTVESWLHRMRRDGYDLPFRRPDLASPAEKR